MKTLRALAILATVVALARIVLADVSLSATWDEPAHIACGLEWLERGRYTFESLHPPLARVATALLPYVAGARLHGFGDKWPEGNAVIWNGGHNLALARLGILPFFVLAMALLWAWTRVLFDEQVAALAVIACSLIPPILAHFALATTDAAVVTVMLAAGFTLWRWLEGRGSGAACGVAVGLGCGTKFSFLVFAPVMALVIFAMSQRRRVSLRSLAAAAGAAFLGLWACYRFAWGMPALFDGIRAATTKNQFGHAVYFLGHHDQPSIWFFPVALALKTPLALLVLALIGATRRGVCRLPLAIAAAILLSAMPSHINLGVRHVLCIYPFLSMLAALGAQRLSRVPLAVLAVWLVVSSAMSGGDPLAYFNELAGDHPERYLVDSDLDWGQDLGRLAERLRQLRVPSLSLRYNGSADLSRAGLPPFETLDPGRRPTHEWVAMSIGPLFVEDGYAWLRPEKPLEKVGDSILLYHFSKADLDRLALAPLAEEIARQQALVASAPTPENLLNLSLAFYQAHQFQACVDAARRALALRPTYAQAWNNVAAGLIGLGDYAGAVKAGEKALELRPDFPLARNNLASARARLH